MLSSSYLEHHHHRLLASNYQPNWRAAAPRARR